MREERGYEAWQGLGRANVQRLPQGAGDTVRHFWGSELLYVQEEPGQHHRTGDLVDPVWGLLDMSPEGRGDFFPRLSYLSEPPDGGPSERQSAGAPHRRMRNSVAGRWRFPWHHLKRRPMPGRCQSALI